MIDGPPKKPKVKGRARMAREAKMRKAWEQKKAIALAPSPMHVVPRTDEFRANYDKIRWE